MMFLLEKSDGPWGDRGILAEGTSEWNMGIGRAGEPYPWSRRPPGETATARAL